METILKNRVENLVYDIGVTPNLKGFSYISQIVEIFYKTRFTTDNVRSIYNLLVISEQKRGNTVTVKQIERNIRHAVANAFTNKSMGVELRTKIFRDPFLESCSNTLFLHSIVMYMIHEDRKAGLMNKEIEIREEDILAAMNISKK